MQKILYKVNNKFLFIFYRRFHVLTISDDQFRYLAMTHQNDKVVHLFHYHSMSSHRAAEATHSSDSLVVHLSI